MVSAHNCESEHDHDHDHDKPDEQTFSSQSLFPYIFHDRIRALNVRDEGSARAIVRPWDDRFSTEKALESDADDQIILSIPFTGLCKLKSILLRCPSTEEAPHTLKLFVNQDDVDFDNVESLKATQQLDLVEPGTAAQVVEYPLKTQFFNNVRNVSLYFNKSWGHQLGADNQDLVTVWFLGFRGSWAELKKDPVITLYESAANPQDHVKLASGANAPQHGL